MKQCSRLDKFGLGVQSEDLSMKKMAAGSQCQRSTIRKISECLLDLDLTADEILSNIGDMGLLDKKFSVTALFDDDDFNLPFDPALDCSIELSLDPPVLVGEELWNSTENLWNSDAINTETENQILQLLANDIKQEVDLNHLHQQISSPVGWTDSRMNQLQSCSNQLIQSQSSEDSSCCHSSGLGSSASSSCGTSSEDSGLDDDDEWNFQSFPELDDDLWNEADLQFVIKPEDTDDESEDVDIMSIVEEVESDFLVPPTDTPTAACPPKQAPVLDAEQLKRLYTVRRVSSDHCYCPQISTMWIDSAENPSREIVNIPKPKSRANASCRQQQRGCGAKRGLQVKRAGARGGSTGGRSVAGSHRSSRHFTHNTREKREQLNQMERERRIGLKTCFEKLRLAVPELAANPKASKDKILLLARTYVYSIDRRNAELIREKMALQKEQDLLNRRLKAINSVRN